MAIGDVEEDALLEMTLREIETAPPILLEMPALGLLTIIGLVQLAMRHPAVRANEHQNGSGTKFCLQLAAQLESHGAIAIAEKIRRGLDPQFDQPTESPAGASRPPAA